MCIQSCNSYDNSIILLIESDDDPTTLSIVTVTDIGMGEGSGTLNLHDY